jgi:hypothetical protein
LRFFRGTKAEFSGKPRFERGFGRNLPHGNRTVFFRSDNLQINQDIRKVFFSVAIPNLIIGKLFNGCFNSPRMPLVFGFDFNRFSVNNPAFRRSRIHQLFTILERNPETTIYLNPLKLWKVIGFYRFSDSKSLVLWVNGIRKGLELPFYVCPCFDNLSGKGGDIAIFINNLGANLWAVQLFIHPNNPLVGIGG